MSCWHLSLGSLGAIILNVNSMEQWFENNKQVLFEKKCFCDPLGLINRVKQKHFLEDISEALNYCVQF